MNFTIEIMDILKKHYSNEVKKVNFENLNVNIRNIL